MFPFRLNIFGLSLHLILRSYALPSSGDGNDLQFPRPRDLDLIQSTPLETLSLKTPPRVLTLNERPLDFLEEEQRAAPNSDEVVSDEAGYSVFRRKEEPHHILPPSHSNSVFHVLFVCTSCSHGPRVDYGGSARRVRTPPLVTATSWFTAIPCEYSPGSVTVSLVLVSSRPPCAC